MCSNGSCTPCQKIMKPCDHGGKGPNRIAGFVKPKDRIAAWFAIQIYNENVPEYGDFTLEQKTEHVGVWTSCTEAIVAFRGTKLGEKGGYQDVGDDIQIALGESCDLAITNQGAPIIQDLYSRGYSITLAGHSLGGKAAICLGSMPGVVNVVVLNAGAPITNPDYKGPGKGTHYHIVGDIISTHVYGMQTVRVTKRKTVDWLDTWFHETDRYFVGESYSFVDAQFEQNDLEDFFFVTGETRLKLINLTTSLLSLGWYSHAKSLICKVPIPGSEPGRLCIMNFERGGDVIEKTLFTLVGGLLGLLSGPISAVTGAFIGAGIRDGNISAVVGALLPGFALATTAIREVVLRLITKSDDQESLKKELNNVLRES
jgi:hypothetical protein